MRAKRVLWLVFVMGCVTTPTPRSLQPPHTLSLIGGCVVLERLSAARWMVLCPGYGLPKPYTPCPGAQAVPLRGAEAEALPACENPLACWRCE